MQTIFESVAEHLIPVLVIGGFTVVFLGMAISNAILGRSRERTRREIAAYVAEGAMSAEDAERLLKAGRSDVAAGSSCGPGGCGCRSKRSKQRDEEELFEEVPTTRSRRA